MFILDRCHCSLAVTDIPMYIYIYIYIYIHDQMFDDTEIAENINMEEIV